MPRSKTIFSFIVQIIYCEQQQQITVQNIKTGQIQHPSSWEEALSMLQQSWGVEEAAEPDPRCP